MKDSFYIASLTQKKSYKKSQHFHLEEMESATQLERYKFNFFVVRVRC